MMFATTVVAVVVEAECVLHPLIYTSPPKNLAQNVVGGLQGRRRDESERVTGNSQGKGRGDLVSHYRIHFRASDKIRCTFAGDHSAQ